MISFVYLPTQRRFINLDHVADVRRTEEGLEATWTEHGHPKSTSFDLFGEDAAALWRALRDVSVNQVRVPTERPS